MSGMSLPRRTVLKIAAGLGACAFQPGFVVSARAQGAEGERHGLSAFGDLKYPADFTHFDYVNPAAPKGGIFSLIGPTAAFNQSFQTFNSLNGYILRGDGAQGLALIFDSLMASAADEPDDEASSSSSSSGDSAADAPDASSSGSSSRNMAYASPPAASLAP